MEGGSDIPAAFSNMQFHDEPSGLFHTRDLHNEALSDMIERTRERAMQTHGNAPASMPHQYFPRSLEKVDERPSYVHYAPLYNAHTLEHPRRVDEEPAVRFGRASVRNAPYEHPVRAQGEYTYDNVEPEVGCHSDLYAETAKQMKRHNW